MASKGAKKPVPRGDPQYNNVRRLISAVALLAVIMVVAAGVSNGIRMTRILYRSGLVAIVVIFIGRLIIKVMASYEEINSGQV